MNHLIETRSVFEPRSNFQIAALLLYQDDQNAIQFGRAYCDSPDVCVGDGLYFDVYEAGSGTGKNFATAIQQLPEVYLRLQRQGAHFTAYFSDDGSDWQRIGVHFSQVSADWIDLITGQSSGSDTYAEFDYFKVFQMP